MAAESGTPATGQRLAVLGAGVMGSGIAALAIGHGIAVTLIDLDRRRLDDAPERVGHQVRTARLMGALPDGAAPGALVTGLSLTDLVTGHDAAPTAVIEAVTEDADAKAKVLAEVSALVAPGTPVISNTSAIPIDELARAAARPADLIGTHFMNPPYLIRTVEVIRGTHTGEGTLDALRTLLTALRREPIVVDDAPGFVTSRILHPMINDAVRVVAAGTASAESVDRLMQGCLGHPTGPLRTADLIGLDNLVDSLWVLHSRTGDEGCRPCGLLLAMVRDGHLGRKSGRGFYEYEGEHA
ncbi:MULTISPECIES: 3-hydroxyacyl-CoA dehydrogenase family protein [Streptomyces]|uniref:3-hydroxyacyl-CoA dehydrogenase family protein n=1 Tax=Streptomyces TaxID=1883 RepID=UPI000F54D230|nr:MULTISPECIES: 3-hydroxyacyl-CoA dehydrogenase family protein [Streptomyces]MDX3062522.1 3-hydroxyacyl-CoA dehydrogenase family protein [Streptomyces sp. ND04-05B]RPK73608.1 putative 3-hydroxybutyryl-CoA dehydrogenase [Streptomyces sp. ADI97-07]WRY80955.1 3-hydroxyacyl-CoA dehydrogenase family protein [Streptomyces clavifer]WUC26715.1 3-hydroxyacyl-CoA dehydrogenase family protein [Streptomyces clavifer]